MAELQEVHIAVGHVPLVPAVARGSGTSPDFSLFSGAMLALSRASGQLPGGARALVCHQSAVEPWEETRRVGAGSSALHQAGESLLEEPSASSPHRLRISPQEAQCSRTPASWAQAQRPSGG